MGSQSPRRSWFTSRLTALFSLIAYRTLAARDAEREDAPASTGSGVVSVDLPAVGTGAIADEQVIDAIGEPPRVTAGQEVARLDTGAKGHGGTVSVREPALNLADNDERMRLSPDPMTGSIATSCNGCAPPGFAPRGKTGARRRIRPS